ncbi:MAG: hypothetical protein ABI382_09865 [Nakamurella sp.]
MFQLDVVDPAHQINVAAQSGLRLVVHGRAGHIQQFAPGGDGQIMTTVDYGPSHIRSKRASPRSKKSHSMVSAPVFACGSLIFASLSAALNSGPASKVTAADSSSSHF